MVNSTISVCRFNRLILHNANKREKFSIFKAVAFLIMADIFAKSFCVGIYKTMFASSVAKADEA